MRVRALALATVALALALAACGGGDEEEAVEAATEAAGSLTEAAGTLTEEAGSVTEEAGSVAEDVAGGIEVTLNEQNASGQSGTATLTATDDGTLHVSIALSGGGADPQPAHIHEGTCADLNPEPAFPLENVADGQSETDVEVSLEDLAVTSYAINVHKSESEADVYVACGDITDIAP
jgi:ABC-type glycerol-3-phosphate transport system substrate-binding protein